MLQWMQFYGGKWKKKIEVVLLVFFCVFFLSLSPHSIPNSPTAHKQVTPLSFIVE